MTATLILLIATRSMVSCASRLKLIPEVRVSHAATVPMMQRGSVIHTPVDHAQLQMLVGAASDDDSSRLRSNAGDGAPKSTWKADISEPLSFQKFPPITIYGSDSKWLLNSWADHYDTQTYGESPTITTSDIWVDDMAVVIHSMRSQVNIFLSLQSSLLAMPRPHRDRLSSLQLTHNELEMVGLIPKHMDIGLLESGWFPRGGDGSVVSALAVFSREKFEDDRRGTLRKRMREYVTLRQWRYTQTDSAYGKRMMDSGMAQTQRMAQPQTQHGKVDVFAIQGLAAQPGYEDHLAHALLYQIGRYANEEQKLVVVPEWAYMSSDGKDLTDYYVGFGFQKVEMEDRPHVLVYLGASGIGFQYKGTGTYETPATIPDKLMIGMSLL